MSASKIKTVTGARNVLLALAAVLILGGIGLLAFVHYNKSPKAVSTPIVFSNKEMLYELYSAYKVNNIEPTTHRTLDKSAGNITTSEGESYTMLRAAWMDDRTTYDQSLKWTQDNLQRPDYLFSWKFGQKPDKSYGVLSDEGGTNTASDGDTDIALSLLMAYERWGDSRYLRIAQTVIPRIWTTEVVQAGGKPIMTADDLEKNSKTTVVVNPSYMSPAAYKIFAKVDGDHDWNGLADNSYAVISNATTSKLDKTSSVNLPPNWIYVDRTTGKISPKYSGTTDSNYGYDAIRIPFRLALDYQWFSDPRDKAVLSKFSFLSDQWSKGALSSIYSHDGNVVSSDQGPAIYGASIGYFNVVNPDQARQIYKQKLLSLYDPDHQLWRYPLSYYDDNWAWFGMALTQGALPNLALTQ